jgi:hypothetical protein
MRWQVQPPTGVFHAQGRLGLGNWREANGELEHITPRNRTHPVVLEVRQIAQRGEAPTKTFSERNVARRVAEAAEISKLLKLFPGFSLRSPRSLRERILANMHSYGPKSEPVVG